VKEYELGWIAGLFEGEGSFSVRQHNSKHGAKLYEYKRSIAQVKSTDEDVIRTLHSLVGLGAVWGPYWSKGSTKPYWQWAITNTTEYAFFCLLIGNYLHDRRFKQMMKVAEEMGIDNLLENNWKRKLLQAMLEDDDD
jgi:hypothetical protein